METETINQTPNTDDDLLTTILKEDTVRAPKVGEIVEGPLLSRGTAAVFVDLGAQGTGIIYGREFFLAQELLKQTDIGDLVSSKVVDPENNDGYVELSAAEAYQEIAWEKLNLSFKEKKTLTVEIDAANRGGLMATIQSVKAFIPVSQLAQKNYPRIEGGDKEKIHDALKALIGNKIDVKIITADQKQDKLILSEKAVEEEALREELKNHNIGDIVEGSISGVVEFGLFIKFGPEERLEGLAHISELSWEPIENISEQYKIGQHVKVKIVDIQGDKASLSLKALEPDPWNELDEKTYRVSAFVEGRPVRVTSFGTFIEVATGVQGIARVSEFADEQAMRQAFSDNNKQTFTIVSLNKEEHRMELKPGEHDIQPKTKAPEATTAEITSTTDQVQTDKGAEESSSEESTEESVAETTSAADQDQASASKEDESEASKTADETNTTKESSSAKSTEESVAEEKTGEITSTTDQVQTDKGAEESSSEESTGEPVTK